MAFVRLSLVFSLLAATSCTVGAELQVTSANPIRKVVTMLQSMQKKITAEGEKEAALYEKFECYCKGGKGDLEASIASAGVAVPQLGKDIEAKEAKLAETKEDLKSAKSSRDEAKAAIADATAVRTKEAAAFLKESTEYKTNIAAIKSAVGAISKGATGLFLQSNSAKLILQAIDAKQDMIEADRQELVAFLSGGQASSDEVPGSAEIVGLLKQLDDEMSATLAGITKDEKAAIASYEAIVAAKKKEIEALTSQIEAKTTSVGELGVEIATMKGDLSDTEAALLADQKFLANLDSDCATKATEWDEITKTRSEELVAVAETIKILNDDDALDLFKKALPSASASSLMQVKVTTDRKAKALAAIQQSIAKFGNILPRLDFIALALHGKKIGFEKVIKMIDEMVATLKTEQLDDDHKKEYCAAQFDSTEDKLKALKGTVSDLEPKIADTEESIAALASEIEGLQKGISALDASVAEATAQRKSEHEEFLELMAADAAAKELLTFAKNRLNKFYNPKLYAATTLLQMSQHRNIAAPPPAPAAPGPYTTKSAESTGVIAMLDKLIKGLDTEMTEAKVSEKNSQEEYEGLMGDSAAKRAADAAAITEKSSAKANYGAELEMAKESKASTEKEAMATAKYMSSLHAECDWLIQYFDVRKEARVGEIEALANAKAVLSGADYALMQVNTHKFLA
mmetsp:Transcript_105033/g.181512  ORF Transcript_105033/g.181512 Transcript_105033/m.181512 type:complete len:687 (-) Transcript_105033:104-2164(-)